VRRQQPSRLAAARGDAQDRRHPGGGPGATRVQQPRGDHVLRVRIRLRRRRRPVTARKAGFGGIGGLPPSGGGWGTSRRRPAGVPQFKETTYARDADRADTGSRPSRTDAPGGRLSQRWQERRVRARLRGRLPDAAPAPSGGGGGASEGDGATAREG